MSDLCDFQEINEIKVDMDAIYDQPDPRSYFRELNKLDYQIPDAAKPIMQGLIDRIRGDADDPVHVLDVGSSYGVNAALLKYDLSMSQLYAHWGQKILADAAPGMVIDNDRSYFRQLEAADGLVVTGLDISEHAVSYATEVGLLDEGIATNLETAPLPDAAAADLGSVDLVVSTGCVGYVTEKTFEKLVPATAAGGAPWFANFVLRMFPFDPIAECLGEAGYVTEKLTGATFVQRRFADRDEQAQVIDRLAERGIDTRGLEEDGRYHAELFVSRPAAEAAALPIEALVRAQSQAGPGAALGEINWRQGR